MIDCPLPGELLRNGELMVVASGYHTDEPHDIYGLLLVDRTGPPYYLIAEMDSKTHKITEVATREANIVPATAVFYDTFGFWRDC